MSELEEGVLQEVSLWAIARWGNNSISLYSAYFHSSIFFLYRFCHSSYVCRVELFIHDMALWM